MASTSSSISSAHFLASKFSVNAPPSPRTCVRFRRSGRVSAAYATAERGGSCCIASRSSSLYEVLGVQMGATCHEIKAAYRRLAKVLHPDVASDGSAADEFIKVRSAYATLSDPVTRADYDRTLFRTRHQPFAMSAATPVMKSSSSSFSRCTRRTWETDQCW